MDESKYYLFYRIDDGEWKSVSYRSFLVNTSRDKIYGQFTSSSWFNIAVDDMRHVDLAVVRLNTPLRHVYDSICERMRENGAAPEFVVARDRFDVDEVRRHLSGKMLVSEQPRMTQQKQGEQLSVTFGANYVGETDIRYTLACPMFVIPRGTPPLTPP